MRAVEKELEDGLMYLEAALSMLPACIHACHSTLYSDKRKTMRCHLAGPDSCENGIHGQ